MNQQTILMPARAEQIPDTAAAVARHAARAGLGQQACFEVQVVMAEVLNNIVSYALPAESILIRCQADDTHFEITTQDHGKPLDMLPSDSLPPADAEGGRGWPIILRWMDSMEYRSDAGDNQLTLRKAFY